MHRRDFLSSTAVGAGAVGASMTLPAWLTGCGGVRSAPELGAREVTELLGRLDLGLASARVPMAELARALPWETRFDLGEPLLQLGAQALVVADVARSIPANTRVPDELRERLVGELPVLDRCTQAYHRLLTTTPPAARRNVDGELRRDPAIVTNAAAFLDERAALVGISAESRERLRTNADTITTRIRRQSAGAVVDACIAKLERDVVRAGGSPSALYEHGTAAIVDAMWAQVVEGAEGTSSPTPPPGYVPSSSAGVYVPYTMHDPEAPPGTAPATDPSPGNQELTAGGVMLAVGPVAFGLATLIGYLAGGTGGLIWGMIIGATPGIVLVVLGIVFLIIGAVQNGRAARATAG